MISPVSVFWFSFHRKVLFPFLFCFSVFRIARRHLLALIARRHPARAYRAPLSCSRPSRAVILLASIARRHPARVHRAPSSCSRAHRALIFSSGPPFEETSKQLLLGGLHLPRRAGVRLRSCLTLQFLDRAIRFEVSG